MMRHITRAGFPILFLFFFLDCFSQTYFPELSPKGSVKQNIGLTTIEVNYERPAARGRKIFGGLVPYDKVWRTGAGNATKITFNQPVVINGKKIDAGTFSILSIPNPTTWTIILNADTTLYGTSSYDQAKDLVRFKVKPETSNRFYESMTIDIDVVPNNAALYISWEKTRVHFPIGTGIDQAADEFITKNLLTHKSADADEYANAADYYFYLNKELDKALTLINTAISKKTELWYFRLKVDILEKQKKYQEAIKVSEEAIGYIQNKADWDEKTKQEGIDEYRVRIRGFEKAKTR